MTRSVRLAALAAALAALAAPAVHADVKTREKTTVRVEGFLGGFINRAAGGNDGITSTLAVKGSRMSRMDNNAGQIVDLSEERVYTIDVRRKEYSVQTFAQMRQQLLEQKKKFEEQARSVPEADREQVGAAARQLEYTLDVNETGQRRQIAGHDARQVIVTVSVHERGRALEEGGGFVMTTDQWLATVPALDELHEFQMKYWRAVSDGVFTAADLQVAGMLQAMIPGFAQASERMAAEAQKLQGAALMSTTTFENVRSAEQMRTAQQPQGGGGGLAGRLAGRIMNRGPVEQRTRAMTMTNEYLSIDGSVGDADVAIPTGFRERR